MIRQRSVTKVLLPPPQPQRHKNVFHISLLLQSCQLQRFSGGIPQMGVFLVGFQETQLLREGVHFSELDVFLKAVFKGSLLMFWKYSQDFRYFSMCRVVVQSARLGSERPRFTHLLCLHQLTFGKSFSFSRTYFNWVLVRVNQKEKNPVYHPGVIGGRAR